MSKIRIEVIEKVVTMKEAGQGFFTTKSLMVYLGGVSKDFIKDLRESGELPFYKLRNTILYRVQDVDRMMTRKKIT